MSASDYVKLRYASGTAGGIIVYDGNDAFRGYLVTQSVLLHQALVYQMGQVLGLSSAGQMSMFSCFTIMPRHSQTASGGVTVTGVISATGGNSTNWNTAYTHTSATNNPHSVTKSQVGLSNVTNESKATMFTNAALTGNPTATTQSSNENSTKIATTSYVKAQGYITSANGGNATTLDGIDSSAFLRSNAADTASGVISFTGGHGAINITSSSILSSATSGWTGDPGGAGKIQYHSNRWYIVSDSSSDRIVQFRRNGHECILYC